MMKPINEQYFDLWQKLDEIWELKSMESLLEWGKGYKIQFEKLQTQMEELDKQSKEKFLPLFRTVYDQFHVKTNSGLMNNALSENPIGKMVVNSQFAKFDKLSRLFQFLELDVLKKQGKCNCQLKHDLKMRLYSKDDLQLEFIKLWEPNTMAELHQCKECATYWEWQPDVGYGGARWKYIGKELPY